MFLLGIGLFTLSSLAGGLATSSSMLLAARALQGAGAALAAPTALSLLTTRFSEGPARLRAIALYATASAAGAALGLVVGGVVTEVASWRWVMFLNVPIGAAVWLVGRAAVAETPASHGRLDLLGAASSTVGMGSIVLGLVEAGSTGWADPLSFVALAVGAATLAAFVYNESRADEPILPLRLFAHGTRTAANAGRGLVYAGFYGSFFFLSQYLQDVRALSPVATGLLFLPIPLAMFSSSQLTSRVLLRLVPEKALMLAGTAVAAAGMALAAMLGPRTPYGEIMLWLALLGVGGGVAMVSLTSASLAMVAPKDAGAASGLVNASQQLGAALGLAVLVNVFGSLSGHSQAGPGRVTRYVQTLDVVFALAAGFAVLALVLVAAFVRAHLAPATAPAIPKELALDSEELALLETRVLVEVP